MCPKTEKQMQNNPETKAENNNVLLVEDSSDDVELIKRKIKSRQINCKIFVSKDGEEALDYMQRKDKYQDKEKFPDPNLILLDIRMPKKNGIEVLKALKSSETLKNIPVVMLTVSTLENDIFNCFDYGCEHYVTKSVGFEKFEVTLEPFMRYYLRK